MDICTAVAATKSGELLEQAMVERAKLIVVPALLSHSPKSVAGTITSFTVKSTNLELISLGGLTIDSWLRNGVTCYFQLSDRAKACEFYYNFASPILFLTKQPGGYACVLQTPEALSLGQRRSSMRIFPRPEYVLGFSLWPKGQFMTRCPETNRVKLNPPLINSNHLQENQIQLLDLSAGGMKLKIRHVGLKNVIAAWEEMPGVVIWLVLHDPQKKRNMTLWFKGRICYNHVDHSTKDIVSGLELTTEGIKEKSGKMVWRTVERRMIKDLATWTYERYLEATTRGVR
ncbi:hypothetical protein [Desulfonatronum sp. SC1]|uniref:hypothetical protein n=1 Tax=Desulfonatronum sp. SC1 TaxID=2109626 RepID=UPI000D2FF596|nr:hypothetical protein [Desulfonatronum sp. SC1]PTN35039.1 hypothetical protein C6366_12015 [Desulfonatronum sp. SC1]